MPIYEYVCSRCGKAFEELVLSERAAKQVVCPHCGEKRVERRPSVFAAHQGTTHAAAPSGGCGHCAQSGSCPMAGGGGF